MSGLSNFNWNTLASTGGEVLSAVEGGETAEMAGDMTEAGLNMALSAVPFVGGILSNIASKLNISENVALVFKYGLSSYGASTSPEKIKAQFVENVYPIYTEKLKGITPENMGAVLTELHKNLAVNIDYHKKLRKFHAAAKSTQLALDWAILEYQSLLSGLDKIVSGSRAKGVKVTLTSYSGDAENLAVLDWTDLQGTIRNGDVISNPINCVSYWVDSESVRSLAVEMNEAGSAVVGVKESGMSKLLTFAGIGFAAFKAFK